MLSCGYYHLALVAPNGSVAPKGDNSHGQCDLPVRFARQVSCGRYHTVILCQDGTAVACGRNVEGQCAIPMWPPDQTYTQVDAGSYHTGLLHSDGTRGANNTTATEMH